MRLMAAALAALAMTAGAQAAVTSHPQAEAQALDLAVIPALTL